MSDLKWQSEPYSSLLACICPGDLSTQRRGDLGGERIPSSAKWFLDDERVTEWIAGRGPPVLWAYGPAATGKTFISSALADHVNQPGSPYLIATATAFLELGNEIRILADFGHPLAYILRQLVRQLPDHSIALSAGASFYRIARELPVFENLHRWRQFRRTFHHVYVIVDGLDECTDVKAVNDLLDVLLGSDVKTWNFRVFITSRKQPQLETICYRASSIEVRASDDDVRSWVQQKLGGASQLPVAALGDGQLLNEAIRYMDGRFLPLPWTLEPFALLELIRKLQSLKTAHATAEMCDALASAMLSVDGGELALYVSSLLRIANVKNALSITNVLEILNLSNIRHVSGRDYTEEDIIQAQALGLYYYGQETRDLRLRSPVIAEYELLLKARPVSHEVVALASFKYLSQEVFKSGPCASSEELKLRFQSYPFLSYAARMLGVHSSRCDSPKLVNAFLEFSSHSGSLGSYLQASEAHYYHDNASYEESEKEEARWELNNRGYGRIHAAAHISNSIALLDALVEQGCDVSAVSATGETALHICASGEESLDFIRALIRHGIDLSIKDDSGLTSLGVAVQEDQAGIVELLIDNGALEYGPPVDELLELAADGWADKVVGLLLRRGVITEEQSREYFKNQQDKDRGEDGGEDD